MIKQQQHIVFLTPGFAESENDSTTIPALQVYLKNLSHSLTDVKLTLIAFQFPYTKQSYFWNGIEIIPLNGKNKRYKKPFIWSFALRLLNRIHQKHPIRNIHSFWIGECAMIGEKFAKKHAINHLVTAMGQDVKNNNVFVKYLKKSEATIITLSKKHQLKLKENHSLNSKIISWFLDTNLFPKPQNSAIDIIGVGSLNTIKNYSLFIKVIAQIAQIHPNLNVEIIGEGVLQAKLEKDILYYNLTDTIKLVGKCDRDRVLKKMSTSTILLHTSTYESFGYVFLEALYAGMHIVSFDVGIADNCIDKWRTCKSKEDFVINCLTILNDANPKKNQLLLCNRLESLNAYKKLYHA